MDLWPLIPLIVVVVVSVAVFVGRRWVMAAVDRGVQHHYDQKIEGLRAEFRRNEELLKSELRATELEVAALRDGALSARANRKALLHQRRLEAVDGLWAGVCQLAPMKALASILAIMKFEAVAQRAVNNVRLQQMFKHLIEQLGEMEKPAGGKADAERPFLSPLAWALFTAYRTVFTAAYARAAALSVGIEQPEKLLDDQAIKQMLKAVLPHQADFIDEHDIGVSYYLLDEIETKLLEEIRRMLDGEEEDAESVKRAAEIAQLASAAAKSIKPQDGIIDGGEF